MTQSHGEKTRQKILTAGVRLWPDITLEAVAKSAKVKSHNVVLYHFPDGSLKDAIARHAVETGNSKIIVQLVGLGHDAIKKVSPPERAEHFKALETNR